MKKLRVAVLGAGKIGKYHVRELFSLGSEVVAILGSTKESSSKTAGELNKEFGVNARPYYVLEELLRNEDLDAVSVCTPPKLHEYQMRMCLENDLHIMCEKPFIQAENDGYSKAEGLFDLAEKKGKTLTVNTQWASIADYFRIYGFLNDLREFIICRLRQKKKY